MTDSLPCDFTCLKLFPSHTSQKRMQNKRVDKNTSSSTVGNQSENRRVSLSEPIQSNPIQKVKIEYNTRSLGTK